MCKQIGVTEQTYYRWRKEYGGLRLNQAKRLKVLAERWRREYNQRRPRVFHRPDQQPPHGASRSGAPPTVKQSLAALRMLFDWLVTGHVLDVNPAHAVRGPKYVVKKGKTPVLTAEEARELLDSIKTVRKKKSKDGTESEQPSLVGLRDRALIGAMVYTFARVGAVLQMKVRDYFVQGRRGWVRLHEKGGKEHEVPCHHSLEQYLDEYIAAAGIAGDPDAPLFQTAVGKTGVLTGKALWQGVFTGVAVELDAGNPSSPHCRWCRSRDDLPGIDGGSAVSGSLVRSGNCNRIPVLDRGP